MIRRTAFRLLNFLTVPMESSLDDIPPYQEAKRQFWRGYNGVMDVAWAIQEWIFGKVRIV